MVLKGLIINVHCYGYCHYNCCYYLFLCSAAFVRDIQYGCCFKHHHHHHCHRRMIYDAFVELFILCSVFSDQTNKQTTNKQTNKQTRNTKQMKLTNKTAKINNYLKGVCFIFLSCLSCFLFSLSSSL